MNHMDPTLDLRSPTESALPAPVQCLGLTFPSDEARREHFTARLRAGLEELHQRLDVPFTTVEAAAAHLAALEHWPMGEEERVRELAERMQDAGKGTTLLQRWKGEVGFPQGDLDAILRLSDPPYYTACPNPFVVDFIRCHGTPYDAAEPYHREPFAADVSEGKKDPIYNAHAYHTKVPHKAVMRYLLHYTEPGAVVFDGFCGTGMTGVAAQLCGDRKAVESLGYRVEADGTILAPERDESGRSTWRPCSRLGVRHAVLNDLSPAATFIAYNYNTPVDPAAFEREARRLLREVETECGWMYVTLHNPTSEQLEGAVQALERDGAGGAMRDESLPWGRINYTVWSDVFVCPECTGEVVFTLVALDRETGRVRERFACPHCAAALTKRRLERAWSTRYDADLGTTIRQAKQAPVLLNYSFRAQRFEKELDAFDRVLDDRMRNAAVPHRYPTPRLMEGVETRRNDPAGLTHLHHFYTPRALRTLAAAYGRAIVAPAAVRPYILFTVQQAVLGMSKIARYVPTHFSQVNQYLSGTLYVGSQVVDVSLRYILEGKISRLTRVLTALRGASRSTITETASSAHLRLPDSSVDYIFVDPPFGANLNYSELNFFWEAWLGVFTNATPEAIENRAHGKGLDDYRRLMAACFAESYRVLKPGRWMTVEFSNTQASVWNAIQTALQEAGFVVANVSALDKQQGSFKVVTTPTAVKQDLVISAYKPDGALEERFTRHGEGEASAWDFIRTHLGQLSVFMGEAGEAAYIAERDPRILYDRLVAWFVRHGVPVPLSSQEFQSGLAERFPERDGMYFLPEQLAGYDRRRRQAHTPQAELFVSDERSAIEWLREFLKQRPSVYGDIQPDFLKQLGAGWSPHEARPELQRLLEANFLRYDGEGEIPPQIRDYLDRSFPDLRGLDSNDPRLTARANDRWYVPDSNQAVDLEKLREKSLLREFASYRTSDRQLRVFRIEAVRAGFRRAWQARDYATILAVAERLPESVLQEDPLLLRWYDQARLRAGRG